MIFVDMNVFVHYNDSKCTIATTELTLSAMPFDSNMFTFTDEVNFNFLPISVSSSDNTVRCITK